MKRTYRLRRPDQFRRVRREGRSYNGPLVVLNANPNRRRHTRCGFVVGRAVGPAVTRNRAKRRLREAVRLFWPMIASGYDLVFVVRSATVTEVAFNELQDLIEQLLKRAGVWLAQPLIEHTQG